MCLDRSSFAVATEKGMPYDYGLFIRQVHSLSFLKNYVYCIIPSSLFTTLFSFFPTGKNSASTGAESIIMWHLDWVKPKSNVVQLSSIKKKKSKALRKAQKHFNRLSTTKSKKAFYWYLIECKTGQVWKLLKETKHGFSWPHQLQPLKCTLTSGRSSISITTTTSQMSPPVTTERSSPL